MRVPIVVVGLALGAAVLHGCSSSDSDVARSTTTTTTSSTVPRVAAASTTTTTADVPERAAIPEEPLRRHVPLRERRPRQPRITRQQTRAHLAQALAARRPGHTYAPAELDQLTNKAMQIRVARSRLARMRPGALETPRAAAMRARIDMLMNEFQAKAGVPLTDVPTIIDVPLPPARRGE